MTETFSHRGARSPAMMATISFLIVLETGAVHFLLFPHAPVIATTLSILGIAALAWLVRDYRALGSVASAVNADTLELRVGRRAAASVPRRLVASAVSPSWRDLPASPEPSHLDPTKPAEPNILITFTEPVPVSLLGGMRRRPIRSLALWIDRPEAFLVALTPRPGSPRP